MAACAIVASKKAKALPRCGAAHSREECGASPARRHWHRAAAAAALDLLFYLDRSLVYCGIIQVSVGRRYVLCRARTAIDIFLSSPIDRETRL